MELTPTAIELINDKSFWSKRLEDQLIYLRQTAARTDISEERKDEILRSAIGVKGEIITAFFRASGGMSGPGLYTHAREV